MPLISGGVLASFARQFGIQLPSFLMGSAGGSATGLGGGYYGSAGYGGDFGGGAISGLSKMAMDGMGAGGLGSLMSLAKNFL